MIRVIALAGGLATGALSCQVPEFTQQYLQRLAGQVDALTVVVTDFDASALAAGLGREQALAAMTGSDFLLSRQADMRRTFARHAVLADNLATLRAASPLARLTMPQRLADPATLSATFADYAPALPLSVAGLIAGGTGLVTGWLVLAALLAACLAPWRKSQKPQPHKQQPPLRREPVLLQDKAAPAPVRPQLMGERR